MRLDRFLSNMGKYSRSACPKAVRRGEIYVNGQCAKSPDMPVDPERDEIAVCGVVIRYQKYVYYMMNKPSGVLSATEDRNLPTVLDLIPDAQRRTDLFPCGRLDRDTVGLLLLTDDGPLAHLLLSPKRHVPKTYGFTLRDPLSDEDAERICAGVEIGEKHPTLPAALAMEDGRTAGRITITEGKYHQIKRMFSAVGNEICTLERLTFGPLVLDPELPRGAFRPLTDAEIMELRKCTEGDTVSARS